MKVRIVADENPGHTRIWDIEKNEILTNVESAYWEQKGPYSLPRMHLVLAGDHEIDAKGEPVAETQLASKALIKILFRRIVQRIFRRVRS